MTHKEIHRLLNEKEQLMLSGPVEYWPRDGLLYCPRCGNTWPTGPSLVPVCSYCRDKGFEH
jgi:hypothetical protein